MARTRKHKRSVLSSDKRAEVFARIQDFYTTDLTQINVDRDLRIQRYAKFRMWTEGKDIPWEDSSDIRLSDMLEKSLRAQDTIHNAVMSQRPVISATAKQKPDKPKEERVDNLIDYQIFEEQQGELMIGELAENFINDGVFTVFIPWIKEQKPVTDLKRFDPVPENIEIQAALDQILESQFPQTQRQPKAGGWDWTVQTGKEKIEVKFYTADDNSLEMETRKTVEVFNGPRPIVCAYEDILCSPRAENLQPPGPSNPGGASHVIKRDYPSVDEIRKLYKDGTYDLMTQEEYTALEGMVQDTSDQAEKQAKDAIAGTNDGPAKKKATSHNRLTRLMVFDCYDLNGDGLDEDVIFWVILEAKIVVKAKYLTEMYPMLPPRRPFAEAPLIPIPGRRTGISLLEILEGGHDSKKALFDAGINANDLANNPFFFYRATAGTRPEVIRNYPGEGYPVADPSRDIHFPQIGNSSAQGIGMNFITMMDQMQEKAVVLGDIQFGRVPPGRSSALRTTSNMSLLSAQGEARPERILRRFFIGLVDLWRFIHGMNGYFLPKKKKYRLAGPLPPDQDPYQEITDREQITGGFDFGFKANVLNTTKQGLQQSLGVLASLYVNPLPIQMGILQPDGFYRLLRDIGDAYGQDANDYLTPPSPEANLIKIFFEEAIAIIMRTQAPSGRPAEPGGAMEHLQKLIAFAQSDDFGRLDGMNDGISLNEDPERPQTKLFLEWLQKVKNMAAQQQQQQLLMQSAQGFNQMGGGAGGRPPEQMTSPEAPMVSGGNEMMDETLPTAGGGGNV